MTILLQVGRKLTEKKGAGTSFQIENKVI